MTGLQLAAAELAAKAKAAAGAHKRARLQGAQAVEGHAERLRLAEAQAEEAVLAQL